MTNVTQEYYRWTRDEPKRRQAKGPLESNPKGGSIAKVNPTSQIRINKMWVVLFVGLFPLGDSYPFSGVETIL